MIEIERKWLLKRDYTVVDVIRALNIDDRQYYGWGDQVYLYTSDPQVRVRKLVGLRDGSESYKMTIKNGSGLSRLEVESDITKEEYEAVVNVVGVKPIHKMVWYYLDRAANKTLELMEVNDGLFVYLEVEFENEEEACSYELPETIRDFFKECTSTLSMIDVWEKLKVGGRTCK